MNNDKIEAAIVVLKSLEMELEALVEHDSDDELLQSTLRISAIFEEMTVIISLLKMLNVAIPKLDVYDSAI